METVQITNIDNETIEITSKDFETFKDVILFDDNFEKCEIFFKKAGWVYLANEIKEIEGREVLYNDDNIDMILENFFDNHLFPEEVFGV